MASTRNLFPLPLRRMTTEEETHRPARNRTARVHRARGGCDEFRRECKTGLEGIVSKRHPHLGQPAGRMDGTCGPIDRLKAFEEATRERPPETVYVEYFTNDVAPAACG